MKKEALFCDGTEAYVSPPEPEEGDRVQFWFRTARDDVDEVYLEYGGESFPMTKRLSKGRFDYYRVIREMGEDTLRYHFRIKSKEQVCYYNRWGVTDELMEYYDYSIAPGFATPDWAKGAVMYQIYTDRFCNGDPSNDVETGEYFYIGRPVQKVEDWYRNPEAVDVWEFYGGDLKGIMDKLDYLQNLGVEVIYCNPLFVSPSNHKYDTQDYDYIDPHVGRIILDGGRCLKAGENGNIDAEKYRIRTTSQENLEASNVLFIDLVEAIHKRGMKIIIDGVFNHCGSFNKWLDRELLYEHAKGYKHGAFVSPDSPFRNYFLFHRTDAEAWPGNMSYDGWWGHDTLPKLNYEESPELVDYVLGIAKKWVSHPYNVDGWRLDVAADLGQSNEFNHKFWKEFRKVVKEANPHALILAEHYGDPSEWLQGDEWDTVMNYDAFMEPVTWFLTGMEKHSDEYREDLIGNADHFLSSMKHHMANLMTPSLQTAMNQLSNHDHSRFLTRTNHIAGRVSEWGSEAAERDVNHAIMRAAIVIQMTWVGAPTLYYGDEAGLCGFTDPDNRRTYPWGRENKEMLSFYREMIQIHRRNISLRKGSIRFLLAEKDLIAYGRFWGDEQVIVVINIAKELREVTIPVYLAEVKEGSSMARLIYSYDGGYIGEFDEYVAADGMLSVIMGKESALVLKNKKW
ncbi:MAG: glycoside hydrolase family 13 protein [Coprococcus sp.]|nr:glycoside hydrolase family 13 protein [Coprococcus sp.]